ncbi:hypothetical protein [Haliangium sp.]|uniref:hypothetical protein n=1 Tax=Haliangium sp. TaxID=2663208 RepID=UPI003D0B245A
MPCDSTAAPTPPARAGTGSRWLLYALGGGLGHLTRAAALARAARARGHAPTLLVNSSFAPAVDLRGWLAGVEVIELSPRLDRVEVGRRVGALIEDRAWDTLVVDTFPRGLGGELVELFEKVPAAIAKIWVHRLLCDEYVAWADLHRFADHYDRILVPGEPAPLAGHSRAVSTAPWLLCDRSELLDRAAARRALGADGDRLLVLVTGTGRQDEIDQSEAVAESLSRALGDQAKVRFSAPGRPENRWPLLPLLAGVDVLVGAGGYNTVHEARATATPLLALARPRRYDRQAQRLRPNELVRAPDELVERVRRALARGPRGPVPDYDNGVHHAVTAIEAVLAERSRA